MYQLQQWLRENNIKSRSGNHFFRGALYIILRNPHCIGLIKHKKDSYPGEHQVIIHRETWEGSRHCSTTTSGAEGASRVQRQRVCLPVSSSTPLALATRRPTPTRTVAVIPGYYTSQAAIKKTEKGSAPARIPAHDLETAVVGRILDWLQAPTELLAALRDETTQAPPEGFLRSYPGAG